MQKVIRVKVKKPPIGGKCKVFKEPGIYVLEECPSVLRVIACTHAVAGGVAIYDGVPDDNGFFSNDESVDEDYKNGRELWIAHPTLMGSWAIDGGTNYGLTIVIDGNNSVSPFLTVVWHATK